MLQLGDIDDILLLGLDGVDALVTIPIGQKFVVLDKNIQYTVNPFSVYGCCRVSSINESF